MSERGYDSDAQFIGSPGNLGLSPLGQGGYARTELSDLSENENENEWLVDIGFGVSRDGSCAMPGSWRESSDDGEAERSPVEVGAVMESGRKGSGGTTQEGAGIERENDGGVCPPQTEQQEECRKIATPELLHSAPIVAGKKRPPCVLFQQSINAAAVRSCSAGAVDSGSKSGSELLLNKKREQRLSRQAMSEPQSVHLADMNIPRIMAPSLLSQSITSPNVSQNRSVDETLGSCTRSVSEGSGLAKLRASQHKKDDSFYSQGSSVLSAPSQRRPLPKTWGFSAIERYLTKLDRETAGTKSPQRGLPGTFPTRRRMGKSSTETPAVEALKSKFVEDFDQKTPVAGKEAADETEETPVRKVSVGWMSGGRRTGYGYTMVPSDERENIGSRAPQTGLDGGNDSRSVSGTTSRLNASSTSVDAIPMPTSLSHRDWSGTTTSLKESDQTNGRVIPLWARVANRVKRQGSTPSGAKAMPGHWPAGSDHSGRDRYQSKRGTVFDHKAGGLFRRMTRIYSSASLQGPGSSGGVRRSATENMQGIKERASGIYNPILQKKSSGELLKFRSLSRRKCRRSEDGGDGDGRGRGLPLKTCGWTRESRSTPRLEPAWFVAQRSVSGERNTTANAAGNATATGKMEQIGSDDTTEDLVYQDCMEMIPGSVR